jgi:serine/threonine-protein kinase PRP4
VQAAFVDEHFDQDYNFCAVEEDPVTKKVIELTDQLQVDKQICSLHSSLSSVGA